MVLHMKVGAGRGQSSSPSCPEKAVPQGQTDSHSCVPVLGKLRRSLANAKG